MRGIALASSPRGDPKRPAKNRFVMTTMDRRTPTRPERRPMTPALATITAGLILSAVTAAAPAAPATADPAAVAFFEQKVRPLLVERCYKCHSASAEEVKGGLLLDSKAGWTKGGELGPVIVPGKPEESLLVRAVMYDDPDLQMPPKGKLSQAEIDALVQWVKMGAP